MQNRSSEEPLRVEFCQHVVPTRLSEMMTETVVLILRIAIPIDRKSRSCSLGREAFLRKLANRFDRGHFLVIMGQSSPVPLNSWQTLRG